MTLDDDLIITLEAYRHDHENCYDTSELGGEPQYWKDTRCDLCKDADHLLYVLRYRARQENRKRELEEKVRADQEVKIQTARERAISSGRRVRERHSNLY